MNLHVSKESIDSEFIEDLIERIKRELIELLKNSYKQRLYLWQDYINRNIKLFSYSLSSIDLFHIIEVGIESINYKETEKEFIIEIDDKKFISGVYVSVYDICKLVNFGNLSLSGTRMFSEEFDRTEKNLEKLEELYYSGELI